jgi:SET and MYND domain-containing protein
MSAILDEGHPVRCIALVELGKLLAVDEPASSASSTTSASSSPFPFPPTGPQRLTLALETLKSALKELMVGFGQSNQGGDVGLGVREQLVKLEKEMSVWRDGIRNARQDAMSALRAKEEEVSGGVK